mmetsp:Transcript_17282/g.20020  ORF Transcript_17282/g.20020 Transcript_17282/m.20020 type:complete len:101 (-) Transcript_17282:207-509(-)
MIASESIAKDTGLSWIIDAASPTENNVDSFSMHAQKSANNNSESANFENIENKMQNLGLNEVDVRFSSNSLHGLSTNQNPPIHVHAFQMNSSQSLHVNYP